MGAPSYNSPTGPAPFGGAYPPGERAGGYHRDGRRRDYPGGVYLVPGYFGAGFYGYPYYGYDDSGYTDQQQAYAPAEAAPQYPGAPDSYYPPEAQQPPARQSYQPESAPAAPQPAPVADQPETTLVFKDGRPSQQVQSYAITSSTLYVLDGARRREIPLNQLDLPATEQVNRQAGGDFTLPYSAR